MAVQDDYRTSARSMSRISPCQRRGDALYPPRILPTKAAPQGFDFFRKVVKDPLLILPEAAYEEPVVVRRSPAVIVSACSPEAVRTVIADRRQDFDRKPAVQSYILGHLLGNGLLLAEGDDWRWQRQTVAPLFRHSEILGYVPVMERAAAAMVETWRQNDKQVRNVAADMIQATYDVIANTVLIGGSEEIAQATDHQRTRYASGLRWATIYGLLNLPGWLPRPKRAFMNKRDRRLRRIAGEMIASQQENPDATDDLLARLVGARRAETDQPMSRGELIDNVLTFLLAGHHTTSAALTWTLYLIACSPEWEERLVNEIQQVVPDGPVGAEHFAKLENVQKVLKESMRLFPPVPFISRLATNDTELCGQEIAKGSLISIPIYAVHRHRSAWDDPDRFDPERFDKVREPSVSSCQFLPFGAGSRICIGSAFSLIEATVLLATFLRAVRFELPEPDFLPIPSSAVTLSPGDGMPLKVTLRD